MSVSDETTVRARLQVLLIEAGVAPRSENEGGMSRDQFDRTVGVMDAELQAAREDTARLDWLCFHDASILRGGVIERRKGNDPSAFYIEWIEQGSGDIVTQATRHADYREAVDAARAAERGEGEGTPPEHPLDGATVEDGKVIG